MFHQIDFTQREEATPFNPMNVSRAAVITILRRRNETGEEKSVICALHTLCRLGTLQPAAEAVEVDEGHKQRGGLRIRLRGSELNEGS